MKREEILKMSREENQNGDEREQKIKLRSYAISAAVGALLCMVFVFVEEVLFDRDAVLIWAIYSGMMFTKVLLDSIKLRKRFDIALSVIWGLYFLIDIVIYILDIIG